MRNSNSSEWANRPAIGGTAASVAAARRGLAVQESLSIQGEEVVSGHAGVEDVVVAMNELTVAVMILAEKTLEGPQGGPR